MNKLEREIWEVIESAAIETDNRVNRDSRGHKWTTDTRGHVRVHIGEFHNRVTCAKCGYSYCIACKDVPAIPCKES